MAWLAILLVAQSGCATDNTAALNELHAQGLERIAPKLELEVETVATALPPQPDGYRIGVLDVLDIQVVGSPEFGARVQAGERRVIGFRVKPDGKIYVPYVGSVAARGRSVLEVQKELVEKLAEFIEQPQVSVDVLRYESQKFYILGEVETPGSFPVNGHVTLLEGLGLAEGIKSDGDLELAYVVRGRTLLPISLADLLLRGDTSRNIVMQHGDLVYVPRATDAKVYVLGDVGLQGPIDIPPGGLTLSAALAGAGGLDLLFANRHCIRIYRGSWQAPRQYTLKSTDVYRYGSRIRMRRGDIIHVAERPLATWYRAIVLLMPFLTGSSAAVTAVGSVR